MGLTLSQALCRRVPCEARPALQALALNGGVADVELLHFRYDPKASPSKRLVYGALARLREGVWDCPKLPFAINDLSALVSLENDVLTIKHAHGSNGPMSVRAEGSIVLGESTRMPLDLRLKITDLELDDRLRKKTPAEYDDLWDVFKPRGRINAALNLLRREAGQPLNLSVHVSCQDLAAEYRHFPYSLDHLTGSLVLENKLFTVDLRTLTAPLVHVKGLIQNPGLDAVVQLDIQAESVPINETFRKALPSEVRKVIDQFQPSGSVSAHASVRRKPMVGPDPRARGFADDRRRHRFDGPVRNDLGGTAVPGPQPHGKARGASRPLDLPEHPAVATAWRKSPPAAACTSFRLPGCPTERSPWTFLFPSRRGTFPSTASCGKLFRPRGKRAGRPSIRQVRVMSRPRFATLRGVPTALTS